MMTLLPFAGIDLLILLPRQYLNVSAGYLGFVFPMCSLLSLLFQHDLTFMVGANSGFV